MRSRAVAEEVVQDVMLELWRRRESLAKGSSPQAYLFQSTRSRMHATQQLVPTIRSLWVQIAVEQVSFRIGTLSLNVQSATEI